MQTAGICVMDSVTPAMDSDEVLFRRYFNSDDRAAMDALFTRHVNTAYRVALALTGNAADAEEAVQTAFVQILTRGTLALKSEQLNVRGWLMTTVINTVRMKLRADTSRQEREHALPERAPENSAAATAEHTELLQATSRCVRALPALYRAPLVMHYMEGFSVGEVAATLQVPEKTLRSQLSRGLGQLREALALAGFSAVALGPEPLAQAPLEMAPAKLLASLKAAHAAPAISGVAAKGIGMKFALAAIAVCAAVALYMAPWSPRGGNTPLQGDGDAPKPAPLPAEQPAKTADKDDTFSGQPGPEVTKALDTKIDAAWTREVLSVVSDDLNLLSGLKLIFPITLQHEFFTLQGQQMPVREVLKAFARERGLRFEFHGDTVIAWKSAAAAKLDELEKNLSSPDVQIRSESVCALGALADKRACSLLIGALKDSSPVVKKWATFSLATFRSTLYYSDQAPGIGELLLKEHPTAGEYHAVWLQVLTAAHALPDEKKLAEFLTGKDEATRETAAEALKTYDSPETRAALLRILGDKNEIVRGYASDCAKLHQSDEVLQKLITLLDRSYFFMSEGATIAAYPWEKVEPALRRLIESGNEVQKNNVATVLSYVRGPARDKAYALLHAMLADANQKVQRGACWAYEHTNHPQASADLIRFIESQPERQTQQIAIESLATIREPAGVQWVFDNYKRFDATGVDQYFVRALGETRDARAEPLLIAMLSGPDPAKKHLVVQGLSLLRTPAAADAAVKGSQSDDPYTRWNASISQSRFFNLRVVDPIIAFLDTAPEDWMPPIAASVLRRYLSSAPLPQRQKIVTALEQYAAKNAPPAPTTGDF